MEPEKNNTLKNGAIGILTVGLIAAVGFYLSQNKLKDMDADDEPTVVTTQEVPPTPVTTNTPPTPTTTSQTVPNALYKNGTYSAKGAYNSPAGNEAVGVSLTVANDMVTGATFTGEATHPASKKWQAEFNKGFTQAVVGKKIDEISLTVVNGSSLTPKGFMNALATIKTQAKI